MAGIPVKCFCGRVVGNRYETFVAAQVQHGLDTAGALEAAHVHDECCRKTLLTHVDVATLWLQDPTKAAPVPDTESKLDPAAMDAAREGIDADVAVPGIKFASKSKSKSKSTCTSNSNSSTSRKKARSET